MDGLTIGEAAKQAHVRIETLRYYERTGLVAPPPRNGANYGGFCTNARIGALSRAGVASSRCQIIHTGLNFLSIGG
jgi:hypothetical protein